MMFFKKINFAGLKKVLNFLNSFDDQVLVFEDTEKDISVSAVSTPNSLKN